MRQRVRVSNGIGIVAKITHHLAMQNPKSYCHLRRKHNHWKIESVDVAFALLNVHTYFGEKGNPHNDVYRRNFWN